MLSESKCRTRLCKHYRGTRRLDLNDPQTEVNYCKAFKNGIPDEISYGDNDHSELTGGEYRELTFGVGTDPKLVKPYLKKHMYNPKLHGTDTLCSTIRDIYMRSTDKEVKTWARMALRMSKHMMRVLYLYRDMLIEKGVDLKANRGDWQFRGSIGEIMNNDNPPKIEVVSIFYNEAFLAPFFLNHYAFADRIRIFYDVDSDDNTKEIIGRYPNVSVKDLKYPDGYDDIIRAETLTSAYKESKADWVIAADADEFVFLEDGFLERQKDDIIFVRLFQVYRNIKDMDLDPSKSIREQRRCGEADVVKGQNANGMKPIVVRTGKGIHWMPGCHKIWNRHKFATSHDILFGAHWVMADPCFCIDRRLTRTFRQSQRNKDLGHSSHYNDIMIENLVDEVYQHRNDGRLF